MKTIKKFLHMLSLVQLKNGKYCVRSEGRLLKHFDRNEVIYFDNPDDAISFIREQQHIISASACRRDH